MLVVSSKNPWILICLTISVFCLFPNLNPLQAEETQKGEPGLRHLTIITDPPEAKVEILNIDAPYKPNMLLNPGRYHISVSSPGFEPEKGFIDISDRDWAGKVVLNANTLPIEKICKKEDEICNDKARLAQEWQKLEKEKRNLAQLRRQLTQEKEKLDLEKEVIETERQDRLSAGENRPESPLSVPLPQPSTHQKKIESKVKAVHHAPRVEAETSPVVAEVQTVPVSSKVPVDPKVTPVATAPTAPTGSVASLLGKAMTYLQTPQPPSAPPSQAEREAALQLLNQTLALDPTNDSIKHALNLYAQRYIIHAGLFGDIERAEKKADIIRTSTLPTYVQPVDVKGKKMVRILVGPFLEKEDAMKAFQKLKEEFHIKDPFLRQYKK